MNDETKAKILDIKEKIHDLTEYLQSDSCRECGDAALQIDFYLKKLSELVEVDTIT